MDVISLDYCNVKIVYKCTGIVGILSWLFVSYIKLPDTQKNFGLCGGNGAVTTVKIAVQMTVGSRIIL